MLDIKVVCNILDELYHTPDLGNKADPLDELMFIILAKKTSNNLFSSTYNDLKKKFKTWNRVRVSKEDVIEPIIKSGGLSKIKARQIKKVLNQIYKDNSGELSLNFLNDYSDKDAELYLTSLYGVGIKTAKCILLYSLKRKVLPVDIHTYNLARELNLVEETYMRNEKGKLHKKLETIIPPDLRYCFHVNAIVHGRLEHNKKLKSGEECRLIETLISRGVFCP